MQTPTIPRRGDIYWLDWHPARGSEQAGRRPGLVVSNNLGNRFSGVVIVAALTTRLPPKSYPFQVWVTPANVPGLPRPSVIMCEQLMTAAKDRLGPYIGSLPPDLLRQVDNALRVALDLT